MTSETQTEEQWTVRRVLDWTVNYLREAGCENPRLDAEILLAHSRNCPRIQLYTQFDEPLAPDHRSLMRSLVKRRAAAEPVAYLVGHRDFFSLDFDVQPGVFIPRPDTETLVSEALDLLKPQSSAKVLELCTGTGCIAIALATNHQGAHVTTVELEQLPFQIAQRNIQKHKLEDRVELLRGNLFEPVPVGDKFDLILSNPPYIAETERDLLPSDVRNHEPQAALFSGRDGLDVIRQIVAQAPEFLRPDGSLILEISPEQADSVQELMQNRGFSSIRVADDLSGQARSVVGFHAT